MSKAILIGSLISQSCRCPSSMHCTIQRRIVELFFGGPKCFLMPIGILRYHLFFCPECIFLNALGSAPVLSNFHQATSLVSVSDRPILKSFAFLKEILIFFIGQIFFCARSYLICLGEGSLQKKESLYLILATWTTTCTI